MVKRLADELTAVVHLNAFRRLPSLGTDAGYDLGHVAAFDRRVDVDGQALAAIAIDHS